MIDVDELNHSDNFDVVVNVTIVDVAVVVDDDVDSAVQPVLDSLHQQSMLYHSVGNVHIVTYVSDLIHSIPDS